LGATSTPSSVGGNFSQNKTFGAYVEQRIGLNDNLFVTGAIRADDNSAFGAGYDLAIYPKVSATWTFENPFAAADWLNLVRLRGAYGAAGQQPDIFAAVRLYNTIPGPAGSAAITPGEVGNADLKPERSEELEAGFDAALLDNRIDLNFTYYNRVTRDALISREVAPSVGFPGGQWVNAGKVSNWGTELGISAQVIRPGGWLAWNLGMAYSTTHTMLDRLGLEGQKELSAGGRGVRHVEGFPLGSAFEWEIVSADWDPASTTGGVINVMCLGPASLQAVRREEATPVPISEGCAQIYQGGPTDPTWEASLNSDFTFFERFRLAGTIVGRGGNVRLSRNLGPTIECCPWSRLAWVREDPVVKAMATYNREGVAHYDASFIRLQELSLTYDVPEELAARVGASRASIGLQMSNVWQIWRASWYSQVVKDRNLQGANRESFYVAEPDIRGTSNFDGTNYVQQPSKALLASVRLTF
jgi:outer membrane receptor protein involved in Fe transport